MADPQTAWTQQGSEAPSDTAWKVHLAASPRGRRKAVVVVGVIAAAVVSAYFMLGGFIASAVIAFVLVAAVGDFLFPVSYRITAEGASSRSAFSRQIIGWKDVRACYVCADGLKISPLSRPTRLEAFRGVYLRFPQGTDGECRDAVIEAVRHFWNGEIRQATDAGLQRPD